MQIKLWGVRGSIPTPLSNNEYRSKITQIIEKAISEGLTDTSKIDSFINDLPDELQFGYGGNTTCVTVASNTGNLYILDCGTGIRELGYELMQGDFSKGKGNANIFMTHNHWDHIQGLPFFTPIYIPGNELVFYSPFKGQQKLLNEQMRAPFFPASFDETPAVKEYHFLDPNNIKPIQLEDDLLVEYYPLKHPNGSYAYRFKQDGKIFIFATDCEFTGESLEKVGAQTEFFMNADLLILDSQYTLDDSFLKIDWGHTSNTMAVNCGLRWNVKNLVLTHHEPSYSDSKLYENYLTAIEHRENLAAMQHEENNDNDKLNILLAREGMTFEL